MSASSTRSPKSSAGSAKAKPVGSPNGGAKGGVKPSDRLNPKTINPFDEKTKGKSAFATVYGNGGVPCRLVHGSVAHRLAWDTPPERVQFDPVLLTLAEGLRETMHPYTFVARGGFKELLANPNAHEKTLPLLPRLVPSIRLGLLHKDPTVYDASLDALQQLSAVVGPAMNPFLNNMLSCLAQKVTDKKHKDKVSETLQILEQNGGKECGTIIKTRIPSYCSVLL